MRPVKAFIFDVFGTVVDWRSSVAGFIETEFATREISVNGSEFADHWRGLYQPAMERIRSGGRGYVALDQLHYENLVETLDRFGLTGRFTDEDLWHFNSAWERLTPWPAVVEDLGLLKRRAIIAPCSNGSIALMTRLAKFAGLPWDCILGADLAQNYKPEAQVYLACCEALRLPPETVMMVAAHNDDLAAAQAAGLQTCFIARRREHGEEQTTDLEPTGPWTRVVDRFADLAD